MVIPLMKQADEQGRNGSATLHFSAAWAEGAARAVEARRALRAFLAHVPHTGCTPVPGPLLLDAELVVSELVTNAVRHAPGPCGMTLRFSDDELVVTVWDCSVEAPVVRERDGRRFGGHGMRVVHSVSSAVTVTVKETGKQIIACMGLTPSDGTGSIDRTILSTSLSGGSQQQP
ncbi:ATP-binding protein [Streptomyces sp. NPDC002788]